MNYSIMMHPVVRMDLIVDRKFEPQLVGYIQRMGCTYAEERNINGFEPSGKKEWVILKDVKGPNGGKLGELIGLFYSLEWGNLMSGDEQSKFYIIMNPRRKGKKDNVCADRKETGTGSDSGDSGDEAGTAGPGPVDGAAGDGTDVGTAGADDSGELPGSVEAAGDSDCE